MVKSHEKKCQNYFFVTTNDMIKCRLGQQEKLMDFDFCEEYLKGVYQTKYCYGSVQKSSLSCSFNLQIYKKINNVKEDPTRKKDSNFDFSQVLRCLVLKECYVVHYHRTLFTPKEAIKNENEMK